MLWNLIIRKITHFVVFGVLTFFAWRLLVPRRFSLVGAWGFAVVYAGLDEWHQSFEPGRVPLSSDMLIDASGAVVALMLAMYLYGRRSKNNQGGISS